MYREFFLGFIILLGYFLIAVCAAFVFRKIVSLPREVFRKTLHIILIGAIFILIYAFNTWWIAVLVCLGFIVLVYPILILGERFTSFTDLLIQRGTGEIKRSLVVAFAMFAILISVCWGWFDEKYLIITSVLAWGLGDAAAALIGKRFGKYIIKGKLVEGSKTVEGTVASFIVSSLTVFIVLVSYQAVVSAAYLPISLITGAVVALVELYTRAGMDTITCPLAAVTVLILLTRVWGV